MAHLLQAGDLILCTHCAQWHPCEPQPSAGAKEYERSMLYIRCGGLSYFVGMIGTESRHPAKRATAEP